jgi:hypothetical protein
MILFIISEVNEFELNQLVLSYKDIGFESFIK